MMGFWKVATEPVDPETQHHCHDLVQILNEVSEAQYFKRVRERNLVIITNTNIFKW